jgi:hypothetical protein
VGKRVALSDRPGFSAAAEGRRAQRAHARRRRVSAAGLLLALGLGLVALVTGDPTPAATAVAAAAFAWWQRPAPDPDRWARGANAEVATARLLARLPRGFVVLHDRRAPGSPGNIDHIVIGPSGVWVIDSKARRAELRIHRGQVWAGHRVVDPRPAARQAEQVARLLGAPVSAVVAVHGRGLRRRGKKVGDVRILPARRLCRRLRRGRQQSQPDVVALAAKAGRMFMPAA